MDNSLALKVARTSRNLSRLLRVMTLLGALAGVAVLAGSVVMPELGKNWIRGAYPAVANITDGQVVLLALIAVLQLALTMVALWWLARMFDCVSGDEPLNLDAASAMRRASRWLLAATIYAMIIQIPASLIVSMYMPEGARFVSIGLGTSHASGILASLVLYAIASIQELAAMVREDNRQII